MTGIKQMLVVNKKRVWSSCTGLFKQLVVPSVRVLPVAREGLWTSLPSLSCIDLAHHKPVAEEWVSLLIGYICL